jgi:hypothetical protein
MKKKKRKNKKAQGPFISDRQTSDVLPLTAAASVLESAEVGAEGSSCGSLGGCGTSDCCASVCWL